MSHIFAVVAAVVWVFAALLVAFPEFVFNGEITALCIEFFNDPSKLSVSTVIPILLAVDIVLGILLLNDAAMIQRFSQPRAVALVVLAVIAYLAVVFGVPSFFEGGVDDIAGRLAFVAFLCVVLPRWLSYSKPRVFEPFEVPDDDKD